MVICGKVVHLHMKITDVRFTIVFSVTSLFVLLMLSNDLHAQDNPSSRKQRKEERNKRINAIIKQEEEGTIRYHKHIAGGVKMTTDGFGGFFEVGRGKSIRKAWLFQLEMTERKHPKEEKLQSLFGSTSPFIFGKINFFYPVKLGVQQQYLLGNKSNKNGVSVTANYGAGISLGVLRPYMVEVASGPGEFKKVRYNSADSLLFKDINTIIGGPTFSDGWKYATLVPGFYAKAAARFDYGRYNELLTAIEVGGTIEYYTKKVDQMLNIKQRNMFVGAYVALVFGRRK